MVMDPLTGQGANNASHAAVVAGEAIAAGGPYDDAFCTDVERRMSSYALPVSDACNARLRPPPAHVQQLFAAATRRQSVADAYAHGFNHPDQDRRIVSDESRTDLLLQLLDRETPETAQDAIQACLGQAESL